jgi:hypothetical protein
LEKYFPDDRERPPVPKWVEKSETHDERLSRERAKQYPLFTGILIAAVSKNIAEKVNGRALLKKNENIWVR